MLNYYDVRAGDYLRRTEKDPYGYFEVGQVARVLESGYGKLLEAEKCKGGKFSLANYTRGLRSLGGTMHFRVYGWEKLQA